MVFMATAAMLLATSCDGLSKPLLVCCTIRRPVRRATSSAKQRQTTAPTERSRRNAEAERY